MGFSSYLGIIIGAFAAVVGIVALGFAAHTYDLTTSGSGSLSVASVRTTTLTMGGETTTSVSGTSTVSVIQSGTYNVRVTYFDPAQPGVQQTINAAAGTYTYNAVTGSGGTVQHRYLEFSPFSYTFTAIATANTVQFTFTGLTPAFVADGVQATYLCSPYTVTLSTTGTTTPFNVLPITSTPEFIVSFYNVVIPTVNTGFTISTTSPVRAVIGTVVV
jgi:hypothetical protein